MTPAILILILGFISPQWQFQTSQKYVTSIFSAEDGTMWCSTAGGILQYDPEVGWKSTLIYPADIPYYRINDISVNDTDLWLATDGAGLALRQDDSWTIFTTFDGVPGTGVVYAVHRTSGYIFAGTDGGLAIGDETGFTPLDEYTNEDNHGESRSTVLVRTGRVTRLVWCGHVLKCPTHLAQVNNLRATHGYAPMFPRPRGCPPPWVGAQHKATQARPRSAAACNSRAPAGNNSLRLGRHALASVHVVPRRPPRGGL